VHWSYGPTCRRDAGRGPCRSLGLLKSHARACGSQWHVRNGRGATLGKLRTASPGLGLPFVAGRPRAGVALDSVAASPPPAAFPVQAPPTSTRDVATTGALPLTGPSGWRGRGPLCFLLGCIVVCSVSCGSLWEGAVHQNVHFSIVQNGPGPPPAACMYGLPLYAPRLGQPPLPMVIGPASVPQGMRPLGSRARRPLSLRSLARTPSSLSSRKKGGS
jgi:hypothetical protein